MGKKVVLPQLAWHGVKGLELTFPDSWQVEVCNMAGFDNPRLSPEQVGQAVANPVGMAPLSEYARGKKEVVIIFDDMARVTRAAEIIPHVLAELASAGIKDNQIRFIGAGGMHGAMNRVDFARKLGEEVLRRFPVYNHAPYDNCVYAGTTTRGTKVFINAEVMHCDLKIGIGSVVPHIMAGFGGGSKIILPGVASYESIVALHSPPSSGKAGFGDTVTGMGVIENNIRRQDIDEAAAIAGLDMKIDAIVNMWGETVAVFAGAPEPTFSAALEMAKKHYLTPQARDKDIVIINAYAKANEAASGLPLAYASLSKKGSDIVLIANIPEGQVTHYLMGPFGKTISGKFSLRMPLPDNVKRLITLNEYPELSGQAYTGGSGNRVMVQSWEEALKLLKEDYGRNAKVAVYPNSDIQYTGEK